MNHVSKIIIIIIIIKEIKPKVKKDEGICSERERERQGEIFIFYFFFFSLLSQIYGNRTVGFIRVENKVDPCSEGSKILGFRQIPRGREFFYMCYFYPKGHLMAWDFLRGRERL